MPAVDETFVALPLRVLADAALTRAAELGASHADLRVVSTRSASRAWRDARLQSSTDTQTTGIAVRVVHSGAWGFAADIVLSPDHAAWLAERAVATARIARALTARPVELADEPVHAEATWVSAYEIDPFTVPEPEIQARMVQLSRSLLDGPGVSHADASVDFVRENTFYADSAGSSTTQQRVRIQPELTAVSVGERGFSSMRTLAPPAGRGWEYLTGTGWDLDAEVAEIPDLLAAHVAAPTVEPGRYDLVIAPSNLFLTIHESVGHATELDRALGYEAAYAGTSFATFDQLGTLAYGSSAMHVTGDRTTPHGLATAGFDDEGVATQSFDLVAEGTLVGYQLNRQMAAEKGLGRSNGCAYADSAAHLPLQRMPNVSLQPAPGGPSTEELISGVDSGLYVVGDKSWSIDMQRYNFQFTGQRFYRIEHGRLAGQVRDVAYQATTTDFWGSLAAVGGEDTYYLGGTFWCGKGQPGQVAPVSHGCPAALFTDVNVLNTAAEGIG